MLSVVKRGPTSSDGAVVTIDYDSVKTRVCDMLNDKPTHFNQVPGTLSNSDADKYIKASFNQETSMVLF